MHVPPMKATPAAQLPPGDGWCTELKWDGARIQVQVGEDTTVLRSGRGSDWTTVFPELTGLGRHCALPAVLDAEVVVFEDGRPSFARLQHRFGVTDPPAALQREHPAHLVVFDLLELDGRPTLELPYLDRRALLTSIVEPADGLSVPPHLEGTGTEWLDLARSRGLEGVVVKRAGSTYLPGRRSPDWVKVKVLHRQDLVVLGWLESRRGDTSLGAVVVGHRDGDRWRSAGSAGSGLDERMRRRLEDLLVPADEPADPEAGPFDRPVHWVEPTVVVEVRFVEWTPDGGLRHPVLLGVGLERDPLDVIREPGAPG